MVESGSTALLWNIPSRDALASRRSGHSASDEDHVKGRHQAPSEGEHALDATRSRCLDLLNTDPPETQKSQKGCPDWERVCRTAVIAPSRGVLDYS